MGLADTGTDQAYLRFETDGKALHPAIVLIAFAPDDIGRVVNVYRPFLSSREPPLTKPRFVLEKGQLTLLPNPLRDSASVETVLHVRDGFRILGVHDAWYEPGIYADPVYDLSATLRLLTATWIRLRHRYFDPDRVYRAGVLNAQSPAFRIQTALFERFATAARDAGAKPIVVLLPDRDALAVAHESGRRILAPLLVALDSAHIEVIDFTDTFLEAGAGADPAGWFMSGGHYSPQGNRLVARTLLRLLLGPRGA